jgi:secreted PhoX family phosphatase
MAPGEQVGPTSGRVSTGLSRLKKGLVGRVFLGAALLLVLVAPTTTSAAPFGVHPFKAGTIVVSQGGTIFGGVSGGTGVEANGEVDLYPPDANGDVTSEASFTNSMFGPTTLAFDPAGDLWVANENTSTLVELTRAQLHTPNPVPNVTISAAAGALANPFGMAFDRQGNLWVVGNNAGHVYEYTKEQLATSGSPTPHTTISDFPGTPLGDAFDAFGDLWVTTQVSASCPQGCVVEFAEGRAGHGEPNANGHDFFYRWGQSCLHSLRQLVDGHRRRTELLWHPLYQRAGGVH